VTQWATNSKFQWGMRHELFMLITTHIGRWLLLPCIISITSLESHYVTQWATNSKFQWDMRHELFMLMMTHIGRWLLLPCIISITSLESRTRYLNESCHTYTHTHVNKEACLTYTHTHTNEPYHTYTHTDVNESCHTYTHTHWLAITGWRRLIRCLKLKVIFRKRATNYRTLCRKTTYQNKASYNSTPTCTAYMYVHMNV